MNPSKVGSFVARELRTVTRTPGSIALATGYFVVVVAVAWFTGSVESGYLAAAATLATPLEVLVPVLAFAYGYRVVLDDRATGELDVFRTYDVNASEYVAGVYIGRLTALSAAAVAPLFVVGALVSVTAEPVMTTVAWYGGVDSFVLLVRLAVLTAALAAATLAVAVAVSAVSGSVRTALAFVVVVWLATAGVADLAAISVFTAGYVEATDLVWLTSLSPNTAFRGLVLDTVVGVAGTDVRATSSAASTLSLTLWTAVSLYVARVYVYRTAS